MRRVAALCLVISLIIIPISAEETLPEEYSDFSTFFQDTLTLFRMALMAFFSSRDTWA